MFLICLCFFLALLGCSSDSKVSGTTSGTENTVSRTLVLSDELGQPTSNARVSIRSTQSNPIDSGYFYETSTNSKGQITLELPANQYVFLEVLDPSGEMAWKDSLYTEKIIAGTPFSLPSLTAPDSLHGTLLNHKPNTWIGIEGTQHFAQVKSNGSFILPNILAGNYKLIAMYHDGKNVRKSFLTKWHNSVGGLINHKSISPQFQEDSIPISSCLHTIEEWIQQPSTEKPDFYLLERQDEYKYLAFDLCSGSYSVHSSFQHKDSNIQLFHTGAENLFYTPASFGVDKLQELQEESNQKISLPYNSETQGRIQNVTSYQDTVYILGIQQDSAALHPFYLQDSKYKSLPVTPLKDTSDYFDVSPKYILQVKQNGSFRYQMKTQTFSDWITLQELPTEITAVSIVQDKYIWIISKENKLRVYKLKTGALLHSMPLPSTSKAYQGIGF